MSLNVAGTGTAKPRVARAATRDRAGRVGRRRMRPEQRRSRIVAWIAVVVIGAFGFLPVYWLVATALTSDTQAFKIKPDLFPREITFSHFTKLARNEDLFHYMVNSVLVSVLTAVLSVFVSAYMAYSFSKFRYRGRKSLMNLVLASQMFPQALLLVTLYAVFSSLGLLNTYLALVLSFTTFTLPLCVWMMKGIFDTIPDALIEAAAIDGASRWRTLHTVVLPLAAPGLVASGLFAFVRSWNDFVFALTLTGSDKQTLPPGLVHTYLGEFQTAWPDLMAASFVVSIPVVAAFMILQRYLVGGLAAGAVKG
ncbi:carbohydrate ABC transporter permease [Actinomadura harenae]|uniref:Carbohydrate ABC transporter permease n=1 Tax=Actinomadura harenae TaxID=2483351 RepID=A0A3M2LZM3_9ACTN|nr:carbohydrate ABC transporter permease [Actinomadura harenae]RMI42919.1 carbohydrate ABC transporter permease [Actinomadura harenae]